MDDKAKLILEHYRIVVEQNLFDEYDILGFLIFLRSYLNRNQFPAICEFCNLIAHRERNMGIVMESINIAMSNNYQTLPNSLVIKDYHGIDETQWRNEWSAVGNQYQIALTKDIIKDIMLCIFSLAQKSHYSLKANASISGELILSQTTDGYLSLDTTEGNPDSLQVSFSTFGPYRFLYMYQAGLINDIVETKREGKELHLYGGKNRLI